MVKRWKRWSVFVLLGGFGSFPSLAQNPSRTMYAENASTFFFEAVSFSSEQVNKSHVDVYLQVPNEELRFVKEGDHYVARYDVNVGVYTPEKKLVTERSWTVEVKEKDFTRTTSRNQSSLTQRGIELDAGKYEFVAKVEDQDSRRSSQVNRSMLVSNYGKDTISVSDIMLVNRLTSEGEKKKIVPNISGNVSHFSDGFYLFFEVYNAGPADSLALWCRVFNSKKEQVYERLERQASLGKKTQSFFKVDDLKLPVGTYLMTMDVSPAQKASAEAAHATTSRAFTISWSDMPPSIQDIDKAVDQMRYIARESEMELIRSSTDMEEKRKRFLEFWTKRDPDLTTPNNELLEEYYRRVEFANKNYTHYLEGWRTDRGMVYIRLGPPENIERHPFDINTKPYEIWYYYQLQREFVFIDETGFGDYRLKYPTTDLWGRIR